MDDELKRHEWHSCQNHPVLEKIHELYHFLLDHDGFGELRLEMKILKRGQKEVILHCGRQYRFVVDLNQGRGTERMEQFSDEKNKNDNGAK